MSFFCEIGKQFLLKNIGLAIKSLTGRNSAIAAIRVITHDGQQCVNYLPLNCGL